jgi:hypothetical protein
LKKAQSKTLNWHYRQIDGEEHQSTPHATLFQGLRKYFKYYPSLFINT